MSNSKYALSDAAQALPLRHITMVWLLVALLLSGINAPAIAAMKFPDPDDVLRLLQVRDWLAGQNWYDVTQYRMNPPEGGPMHWSRIVDLPLALVILITAPIVGNQSAEIIALILVPMLTLFCVMWLIARLTGRIAGREAALLACFLIVMIVPVVHQIRPMRIDHHGWQIALALLSLTGLIDNNQRRGGLVIGLSLAAWLSISMEGLPLAAAFMGYCALSWLIDAQQRHRLATAMAALAGGTAVLFAATRLGSSDAMVQYCDALSPAHIAVFGLGAAMLGLLARINLRNKAMLIGGFALTGIAAIALLASVAPQCASGAFSELDPLVREFWYIRVSEGLPLWEQTSGVIAQIVAVPLLAMIGAWRHWRNQAADKRALSIWLLSVHGRLTIMTLAALSVAILVERASAVASVYALPVAAALLINWLHTIRAMPNPLRRIAATLGMFLLVAPGLVIAPASALVSKRAAKIERVTDNIRKAETCNFYDNLALLNQLPVSDFMTPLDTGPGIAHATHHRIVATGHHRNDRAMRDIILFFSSTQAQARAIAQQRDIEYIAYCDGVAEPMLYAHKSPAGLMAQLQRGDTPIWLAPVEIPGTQGLNIWRVRKGR